MNYKMPYVCKPGSKCAISPSFKRLKHITQSPAKTKILRKRNFASKSLSSKTVDSPRTDTAAIEVDSSSRDAEFVIPSQKLNMVTSKVSDEELPFDDVYDIEAIRGYYTSKPIKLGSRVAAVAGQALKVACLWIFEEKFKPQDYKRGEVLKNTVSKMGPVFVKLGQTLSNRPDLIGKEAAEALKSLQNKMPQYPDEIAYKIILEELGWNGPISPAHEIPEGIRAGDSAASRPLFAELSLSPVSAASLGQVYKGRTHEGLDVAVKVQRPQMLPRIALDLFIAREFLAWWEKEFDSTALTPDIADSLGEGLFAELDYRKEGKNMEEFEVAHADLEFVRVPSVQWDYSGRQVLTTQWIYGRPLSDLTPKEQLSMSAMGVESSVVQLLQTGVLHADPHEGNLLYGDDGLLYFLDFGLISRMELRHMEGMASAILHLLSGDWDKLMTDFKQMEVVEPPFARWDTSKKDWVDISPYEFERAFVNCLQAASKTKDGTAVQRQSFGELFVDLGVMATQFRFTCPPYYILVMRSFVTLEGVAAKADPNFNIYQSALPYALRRALTPTTPYAQHALREAMLTSSGELRTDTLTSLIPDPKAKTSANASEMIFSEESVAKAKMVAMEVITSSQGAALRRVLYEMNSVALALFLASRNGKNVLAQAFRVLKNAQAAPLDTDSEDSQRIRRAQQLGKLLMLHHLRTAYESGLRGVLALIMLGACVAMLTLQAAWVDFTQYMRTLFKKRNVRPSSATTAAALTT